MMRDKLMKMLHERADEIVAIRRHLHQNPEVSFKEQETAKYIADFYDWKDVEVTEHLGNGYGVLVTINKDKPGKTLALRADFDALPITEATGLPFSSKNEGVMHACGHDGHTAYLMVLADCLIALKDAIPGPVKIIHQHAEEVPPGGAKSIMESGVLDDVDRIYGIHFMPYGEPGDILYGKGVSMAGRDMFQVKIQGIGGHGSSPHNANDTIVAGSYFVTALQTVISRRLNPTETGVVTVGSFDGKGQFNIIKDAVEIEGDVRHFNAATQTLIRQEITRIAKGLEAMFDVEVELIYTADYPVLVNDPAIVDEIVATLTKRQDDYVKDVFEAPAGTGSEDFAYYLEKIPGAFIYIGASPQGKMGKYNNHHPKFDIHEDALLIAAKVVGDLLLDYYEI